MEEIVINIADRKEYTVTAIRNGENQQVCPVCSFERKKSKLKCFSYNAEKGVGNCSHCGVSLVKKKEFIKEPKIEYAKPVWRNNTEISNKAVLWFKSRGIGQSTITKLKISESKEFMPQVAKEVNTIQFNYFRDGELVNIKFRDGAKNFKLSKGAELIFYNLDSLKNQKEIIIVEGEMDCLSFIEAGINNVISVPNGATTGNNNLTYLDNCIDLFHEDLTILLALDNDNSGNNLRDELARRFGFEKCKKVNFKDCKDANECLVKYGINGLIESVSDAKDFPIVGVFTAYDIDEEINDYYYNGLPSGVKIGVPEFDEVLSFHKGYITTITGIPNHGKSEFLDFLCVKLNLIGGWKFGLYSPENHPLQLHFSKIAEKLIGKSFTGEHKMSPMELGLAKTHFDENFYFIKPKEDFTLDNIISSVKQLIRRKGINAFVIDAWNKIDHHYTGNETQYISKALDKLALFCETNNVHLFLVAHPTKIQKDKQTGKFEVPNLYQINGSANFFNKTSNGISVYRNFGEDKSTSVFVQKVKFKHWGSVGSVCFNWNYENGRYHTTKWDSSNWVAPKETQLELIERPTKMHVNTNFDKETTFWKKEIETDEVPF
jgi:twinkle protein